MADSHDNLPMIRLAIERLEAEGAECLLHAGDFIAPFAVQDILKFHGPVHGCFGNNDGEKQGITRIWPDVADPPRKLTLAGRIIILAHDEAVLETDEALPADVFITPPVIGLLAALGYAEICVYRKPKVSVVITGDELLDPQDPLEDGKIRDVNTYTIQAALQEMGIKAISFRRAIDDPKKLQEAVSQSLSSADILIVSGGVSVGDYDFAKDVFEGVGVREVFWRVAVKPGKPTFFGTKGEKLVFGLPGNPASALVIFYLFARPAIFRMMGREETRPMRLPALMKSEIRKKAGRQEYLRGRFQNQDGKLYAELHGRQFSHMMSSFANSNCLIIFPKEKTKIAEGEEVQIQLLPWTAL